METTADAITTTDVDDPRDEVVFDEPTSRAFSGTHENAWWLILMTLWVAHVVAHVVVMLLFRQSEQPSGARASMWWWWPMIALAGVLLTRAWTAAVVVNERGLTVRRLFVTYDVPWSSSPRYLLSESETWFGKLCIELGPGRVVKASVGALGAGKRSITDALTDFDPVGLARVRPCTGQGIRTRTILPLLGTLVGLAVALASTDDVYHATDLAPDDHTRQLTSNVVWCVVTALAVVACLVEAYRRWRRRRAEAEAHVPMVRTQLGLGDPVERSASAPFKALET